jgi:hypothetical protein
MGSLRSALDRLHSSNSIKYLQSGPLSIKPVYVAFAANSDLCLSFLRQCADYGEKVIAWCLPSIISPQVSPTSSRAGVPLDLLDRAMRLRSEITGVSVENDAGVQGLSLYESTSLGDYH